ncbi:hypothetical protein [Streptomyces sp. CC219B]|uniref:hypothetical protein n=1 Tax=Streptomyces sp. CC219B TaxID=3044574 RepID=UPI0024A885A6|nr:hypothetical protein [Streptomyces sp. CC219B]
MAERKALRELAQGGVLLSSRALDAGWPRRSLTRAVRREGWTRLRAGAWVQPGHAAGFATHLRAVQLLHPQLVVSHLSAAGLWRIETLTSADGAALEFVDPELGLRREGRGVRVYRIPLDEADVAVRNGLRVTNPARTLADLLRSGPRDVAIVALESALTYRRVNGVRRAPLTRLDAVAAALEAPLQGKVRGQNRLGMSEPRSGSPAETIARLRMYDVGLHPESQAELLTPDGRRLYLDFLFRAEGLAVEIEGYAYHGTRDAHRRDVDRFNQVMRCPEIRSLLRFTAEDVFHHPDRMIREILSALDAARS